MAGAFVRYLGTYVAYVFHLNNSRHFCDQYLSLFDGVNGSRRRKLSVLVCFHGTEMCCVHARTRVPLTYRLRATTYCLHVILYNLPYLPTRRGKDARGPCKVKSSAPPSVTRMPSYVRTPIHHQMNMCAKHAANNAHLLLGAVAGNIAF